MDFDDPIMRNNNNIDLALIMYIVTYKFINIESILGANRKKNGLRMMDSM